MGSMIVSWLSLGVAGSALVISLMTLWLTHLKQGTIKLTRPSQIYFGPDGGPDGRNKVFIQALLYATSIRGRHLEDLYVEVLKSQTSEIFPIWVYGERHQLKRGSGFFVGREGVSVAHHFLRSEDDNSFHFAQGSYKLNVFARIAGVKAPVLLSTLNLDISVSEAAALQDGKTGLYFDWGPRSQNYVSNLKPKNGEADLIEVAGSLFDSLRDRK